MNFRGIWPRGPFYHAERGGAIVSANCAGRIGVRESLMVAFPFGSGQRAFGRVDSESVHGVLPSIRRIFVHPSRPVGQKEPPAMKRIRITCFVLFLLSWTSFVSAAEWRVGVARTDITPGEMIWMAGYGNRKRPAEGSVQPLLAKALLIEDSCGQRVVIVTVDLIGDNFTRRLSDKIAKQVRELTGIERDRILLNFSHTHCGPVESVNDGALVTYGLDADQQAAVNRYTQVLQTKLVGLIEDAAQELHPARLAHGVSEATFGMNRRKAINPDGPVDHTVPVLRVSDEDGKLLAVLFGYACHTATLTGEFCQYNGDYAGFAQAAIERAHPGVTAMYMAGCGADINPSPRGTLELVRQHGNTLAGAVDKVMGQSMHAVDGPLTVAFERVDLPFVDPPSKGELQGRIGQGNIYEQRLTEILIKRIDEKGSLETKYSPPVQVLKFGEDLTLVGLPGETVVDYALRLRGEHRGMRLWVAGYCNEVFAYIPSERVLAEGGYEAAGAMKYFGFHGPFKPGVEERVVKVVERLIEQ